MSDNNENPRRRDRRRRNRNRDTANTNRPNAAQQTKRGNPPAKERARRIQVPEIPAPPRMPTPVCARCGEPIQDLASALSDKSTGTPVHFDCVLKFLQEAERINENENENLLYIGQGRFAVVVYDDPSDKRKFTIVRQIEWEGREARAEWRSEIAGHYSQVH